VDHGLINNDLSDRENKSSVKPTILLWLVDILVYFLHARRVRGRGYGYEYIACHLIHPVARSAESAVISKNFPQQR
jgi:hypothetical protein